MKEKMLKKEYFDIRDLANIVNKETQTIRMWEKKNIIPKANRMSTHGEKQWREYSKEDLANILEKILIHPWERKIIKNQNEIKFIIDYLRGEIDSLDSILGDENEDGDN